MSTEDWPATEGACCSFKAGMHCQQAAQASATKMVFCCLAAAGVQLFMDHHEQVKASVHLCFLPSFLSGHQVSLFVH